MRVLLCTIPCSSFICLCNPSPHIYTADSLKLENIPQVSSSTTVVDDHHYEDAHLMEEESVDHVNGLLNEAREEDCAVEEEKEGLSNGEFLKSSFKKAVLDSEDGERIEKRKKVQWVDFMGKELVEIRVFESSEEEEDMRYDGDQSCVCVIQ